MFRSVRYVVCVLLFTTIGCSHESPEPKTPVTANKPATVQYATIAPSPTLDRDVKEAQRMLAEQANQPDWHIAARNSANRKAACYNSCLTENTVRLSLFNELQRKRETVRHICHKRTNDVVISTAEDSPTAHNRIVENEGTRRLEYRERNIRVVVEHSPWVCPAETDEELKLVASKWMDRNPEEVVGKPCELIRTTSQFDGIDDAACQRWVKE